jgi:hypothetical protein
LEKVSPWMVPTISRMTHLTCVSFKNGDELRGTKEPRGILTSWWTSILNKPQEPEPITFKHIAFIISYKLLGCLNMLEPKKQSIEGDRYN